MDQYKLLAPLLGQLEALDEALKLSPYAPREERLVIENEITELTKALKEGDLSHKQGEEKYQLLAKRALLSEVSSVMSKLRQLNPTSPRVENLRALKQDIEAGAASFEQGKQKLQEIMGAN
jgi:hypothetical protein